MSRCKLRTPWPIHFKLRIVIGIDSLMVCILFGEIAMFHSRVMGLYSSNCRRYFVCHAVNWESLGQFTSNFTQLLELIVLRSVYFLVKFRFFHSRVRNKNRLWRPCLLMDRNEMWNHYRGPPIDDTYQVTVHLAKRFQRRRFFRNQPIRNKNCLCLSCLLTDRDEMSNLYRGPYKDTSYQVTVHLAIRFQRRRI
jgi:hypothetical protein